MSLFSDFRTISYDLIIITQAKKLFNRDEFFVANILNFDDSGIYCIMDLRSQTKREINIRVYSLGAGFMVIRAYFSKH